MPNIVKVMPHYLSLSPAHAQSQHLVFSQAEKIKKVNKVWAVVERVPVS